MYISKNFGKMTKWQIFAIQDLSPFSGSISYLLSELIADLHPVKHIKENKTTTNKHKYHLNTPKVIYLFKNAKQRNVY